MNPLPIVRAALVRNRATATLFIVLIALAVALGIAISAQERALRQGSARAAYRFDLIVAAPGSQNDVLFSVVYLDPTAVELLSPETTAKVLSETRASFAAPIGFGDSFGGMPVVGTTTAFVEHLSGVLAEGRVFDSIEQTVVGALVPNSLGDHLEIGHGAPGEHSDADDAADTHAGEASGEESHDHAHEDDEAAHGDVAEEDGHHHSEVEVVARLKPTGTPWDRAVIVPIEYNWRAHGLVV